MRSCPYHLLPRSLSNRARTGIRSRELSTETPQAERETGASPAAAGHFFGRPNVLRKKRSLHRHATRAPSGLQLSRGAGDLAHRRGDRGIVFRTSATWDVHRTGRTACRGDFCAARSEAERLSQLKDEFLATLSHELRTPLNAVQGWATLRQREVTAKDFERGLETIERNVRARAQIINNAIDAVRQSAEAKRIRIQSMLDSRIGLVRGDPNRLQQVLWNLLSNAVKFTSQGGRMQIVLERVNSHVEIVVEDSGIGIYPRSGSRPMHVRKTGNVRSWLDTRCISPSPLTRANSLPALPVSCA